MPLFEYACRRCSHRFETLVREGTRPSCPSCRSEDLEKQLSVFAVSAGKSTSGTGLGEAGCGGCCAPGGTGSCPLN